MPLLVEERQRVGLAPRDGSATTSTSPPSSGWPCSSRPRSIAADSEPIDRDGRGAERQAGQEDPEALQAGPQVAQREAQPQSWPHGVGCPATMRPSSTSATRSQRAARRRSWVTRSSVAPSSRFSVEQQFDDLPPGVVVEIAGGLVGEDDLGTRRQRAGDRHALLLAARQLARIMASGGGRGRRASASRRRRRRRCGP